MPRDSNGNHSLPSGTLVSSGDTILVSQHNPAMQDISQSLTNSLDRQGTGGMLAPLNMNGNRVTNVQPGSDASDVATLGQVVGVPVGASVDYWGDTPPSGFLFCDGSAISRTEYSELFTALGTKYGIGDGVTTFNLPDRRANGSVGRADMGGTLSNRLSNFAATVLGSIFGSQSHTLTTEQIPAHNHTGTTASAGNHTHTLLVGEGYDGPSTYLDMGGQNNYGYQSGRMGTAGAHTHTFTTANQGGGQAHNIVQPSIVCNVIIRVRSF